MRFIQDIWIVLKSFYYNPAVAPLPAAVTTEFNLMFHDIKIEHWKRLVAYTNRTRHNDDAYIRRVDEFNTFLSCVRKSFPAYNAKFSEAVDRCNEVADEMKMMLGIHLSLNPQILFKEEKVNGNCPICFDEGELVTLHCNHSFHESCIMQWIRTGKLTCPYCRTNC